MEHQVTADHNEKMLHVSPGDTVRVELEENPTTGYSWAMEELTPLFAVQKNDYELLRGAGIGGGGMRSIVLKIEQSGSGEIRLKNWQRWSGDVYQTFRLQVDAV